MRPEELREEIPIEEVLAYFGARIPAGRSWSTWQKMVCPFCSDTNGSATVNKAAQRFICHQCGAPRDGRAGDIVDIAIWADEANEYKEAVEWLTRTFRR